MLKAVWRSEVLSDPQRNCRGICPAMAGELSVLIEAGMDASIVKKLEDQQIDKELFPMIKVQFMRDVLNLTGFEIMQVKTYQSKNLLSSNERSERPKSITVDCAPASATPPQSPTRKELVRKNPIELSTPLKISSGHTSDEDPFQEKQTSADTKSKSEEVKKRSSRSHSEGSSSRNTSSQTHRKSSSSSRNSGSGSSSRDNQTQKSSSSSKSSGPGSSSRAKPTGDQTQKSSSRSKSSGSGSSSRSKPTGDPTQKSSSKSSGSGSSSRSKPTGDQSIHPASSGEGSPPKQRVEEQETSPKSRDVLTPLKSKRSELFPRKSNDKPTSSAPPKEKDDDEMFSDDDSNKENTSSAHVVSEDDLNDAVEEFKADPEPSFASLKQSLPKFDVVSILHTEMKSAHSRYKASFIELLQNKHLDRTKRLCIIRKLTGYLYNEHAASPSEVTPAMKEGMAKSFCVVFPKFANTDDTKQPWSPLFSPSGPAGYIANASRAFMKQHPKRPLPPSQSRKRKAAESNLPEMDDDEIQALSLVNCGRDEKNDILDGMARCFQVRQAERARQEPISFFMRKYCQFDKYGGEVLSEEFKRLKPDAGDMCKVFLKCLPKILSLNLRREVDLPINDDAVKALVILSQHLPHDIPKRNETSNQSWADLKDIIVILKPSDNIQEYVENRIEKAKSPIQPYLIFVRGLVDKNRICRVFIVLDSQTCAVETTSSIKGVDWLFQCYFIFNVNYPFGWRNTFHFLQTCFYKLFEHQGRKKDKVNASEFELWQKLK